MSSFAFVASTAGSVMNRVLEDENLKRTTKLIIVDRPCKAEQVAKGHDIELLSIYEDSHQVFSDKVLDALLDKSIDYVFSYYTKFFAEPLRTQFQDRLINFHPSILPAFKGMDGFGDTLNYHTRYFGNTVEFIDKVMDEGKIIMQTIHPKDERVSDDKLRHILFEQQCKTLLQLSRWLEQGRVRIDGRRVVITDASFEDFAFSPSLEDIDIKSLSVPFNPTDSRI